VSTALFAAAVDRMRMFAGEERRSAVEKFVAVCSTMPESKAAAKV
jgi:hypothetical protein